MTRRKSAAALSEIVVDASVLAKTLVHEPESDDVIAALAQAAQANIPLLVLPLTRYEVGNVLVKLARRAGSGATQVDVEGLVEHSLTLVETREAAPGAAKLATAHGLSFYDASYLALALGGKGRMLWTFDARLGRAAEAEARRVSIDDITQRESGK